MQTTCFAVSSSVSAAYYPQAQALTARQEIRYTNDTDSALEYLVLSVYPNAFRRESTLPCDNATLEQAFYAGYAPSGIEFSSIRVDGEPAAWGFLDESECFLRVDAPLDPGEACVLSLEYTLLLSENRTFLGAGDADTRLCMFCPTVCARDEEGFLMNPLSRVGVGVNGTLSDYSLTLALPDGYELVCGGTVTREENLWHVEMQNVSEPALCIGRCFHTAAGERITVYGQNRAKCRRVLRKAEALLAEYEALVGEFPYPTCSIVLSEAVLTYTAPGLILLSEGGEARLDIEMAKQYFGCAVFTDPYTDPFLSSGLSRYVSLLAVEEAKGAEAFEKALTKELLPALSYTIPGGLTPDSRLNRFSTVSEYRAVAEDRGAAVFHELRVALGREAFLAALRTYYAEGRARVNTIEDFVTVFETSTGRNVGSALIAYLYTIDEYAAASPEYFD